jgi:hypothetical protein
VYNSNMALWWALLGLGVALYLATTAGTIAAYGNERVPRLGFWPDRRSRSLPWWTWLALGAGILLLSLAANHLASWDSWTAPALFLGCVLLAWVIQSGVIAIHNRRSSSAAADSEQDEPAHRG